MDIQQTCSKCSAHGLTFARPYSVAEFLEGYPDSPIWIIGLNPAAVTPSGPVIRIIDVS